MAAILTASQLPRQTSKVQPLRQHWNGTSQQILLLSSVGRSGSSFLGGLLSSYTKNLYMYEPIGSLQEDPPDADVVELLGDLFQCKISDAIIEFSKSRKSPSNVFRHPVTYTCSSLRCLTVDRIASICRDVDVRIIKTIRTRLALIPELLEDQRLDLKVLHLVRDPRGSLLSMRALGWDFNPDVLCIDIEKDLERVTEMNSRFPDRYMLVRYEDICTDPWGKTKEILRFLHDDDFKSRSVEEVIQHPKIRNAGEGDDHDLPLGVVRFLNVFSAVRIDGIRQRRRKHPYSLFRDTAEAYQAWRMLIDEDYLQRIETKCRSVIRGLGYRFFGSQNNAKNLSLSLFQSM